MGQSEVLNLLKKHKEREFDADEVSKLTGVSRSPTQKSLNALYKQKFIRRRYVKRKGTWLYLYKYKE